MNLKNAINYIEATEKSLESVEAGELMLELKRYFSDYLSSEFREALDREIISIAEDILDTNE